jgi:hypothetical protein
MMNLCSPPMCGHASDLNGRFGDMISYQNDGKCCTAIVGKAEVA